MEISFQGKRALVTGAGQGIGRGIAERLLKAGAKVYALSKTAEHLESLKKEHPEIETVQVDVSDWNETRKAVEAIGPVDLLVNNAGMNILESFLDVQPESFDKIFAVNLKSVINISQVVAKAMIEHKIEGSIVNISSQASQATVADHTVYIASKAALDAVSKAMALELGPHKIRVNCVNPTVVMTAMGKLAWSDPNKAEPLLQRIPLGKFAEIDHVVDATIFLLSDQAAMTTGATFPVEGGYWVN